MATSYKQIFSLADDSIEQQILCVREGLPASAFAEVASTLDMPRTHLAAKLDIAPRTLTRKYGSKQKLSREESEKILRLAKIRNLARTLFNNDQSVSEWLSKPASALNGVAPIDLLDTHTGISQVESLLQGIAHGNFI